MKRFKVLYGRWRYFPTLADAVVFAGKVFRRTGIFIAIESA